MNKTIISLLLCISLCLAQYGGHYGNNNKASLKKEASYKD